MSCSDPFSPRAEACMRQALELAARGMWHAAPNPCVGAVLTRDDTIVAQGWHTQYGHPHAEVEALRDARQKGLDLAHCTLWVTLEPCNHQGKTPPCTQAILEAGIPRVMVGCLDPNPDVAGGGVATLRQAGVHVHVGVCEQECRDRIADFVAWKFEKRPYVFLKLASTLDGRIATRTGHSRWISGPESRRRVHELRRRVQAVLAGGGTFHKDDPQLTCRLEGEGDQVRQPLAVVLTSRLPHLTGASPRLVAERPEQTIFFTSQQQAETQAAKALQDRGCTVLPLPLHPRGGLDLQEGLRWLFSEHGCLYLLCEGGGGLGLSMLERGLADELQLYLAPKVLGDAEARPLFHGRSPQSMSEALGMRMSAMERCGDDVVLTLRPQQGREDEQGEPACSQD